MKCRLVALSPSSSNRFCFFKSSLSEDTECQLFHCWWYYISSLGQMSTGNDTTKVGYYSSYLNLSCFIPQFFPNSLIDSLQQCLILQLHSFEVMKKQTIFSIQSYTLIIHFLANFQVFSFIPLRYIPLYSLCNHHCSLVFKVLFYELLEQMLVNFDQHFPFPF